MDMVTLLVDLVIALWILAVIAAIVRAWQAREPRLARLAPEDRTQFVAAWQRITNRFVDAPREAVQEADVLVLSLLGKRGHSLRQDRLPKPVKEARHWLARESSIGTEALRQAMLRYRAAFVQIIGRRPQEPVQDRRREMA